MNAPFYVEVLGRGDEVRQRQRLENLPIRIGRGYDNDFILDDSHTSAHHAVIELAEGGGLRVRDLGSRNGVVSRGHRQAELVLDGDTVFRLGHTSLRIRSADYTVADEVKDTTHHGWEGWPPALAGLLLIVLLTLAGTWLADTENMGALGYLSASVGVLAMALLWSGGWTLANRLFGGQTRFGRHLFIAAVGLVGMELVSQLLGVLAYSLSLESLARYAGHAGIAIASGMVYFHLHTINPARVRRFVVTAVLCAVTGSGLTLLFSYQNSGRYYGDLYMGELLPPPLQVVSDRPVEGFLSSAEELKAAVDEDRSKAVSGDDTEDFID